jgi:thymidylate kinase
MTFVEMADNSRPKDETELKIVILGPDGAGKSSVIQGLIGELTAAGRRVKMRHLKPRLLVRSGDSVSIVTDPHGKPPRSALVSVAKVLVWLIEEWYATLFQNEQNTLLICDRYYHDLLVDPMRYRYGGPIWVARCVGKLMPQPDLWVLLNAPATILQTRKQEVPLEETMRQCDAYLALVRDQKRFIIVDATQSLEDVVADIEDEILKITTGIDRSHG